MKIDLGAGDPMTNEKQAEGYTLQDAEALQGIDIVCDIRDLYQHVQPETVSHFRGSHVFEHFPTREVVPVLSMLKELLEMGGEMEIYVPNFAWHANLVSQGKDEDAVYYAFGGQLDEFDFHKTGFTPKILKAVLMRAGYSRIMVEDGTSLHALAYNDAQR